MRCSTTWRRSRRACARRRVVDMSRTLNLAFCAVVALALAPAPAAGQGSSMAVDENLAKRGKSLFTSRGCNACHAFGKKLAGPDLVGATERRDATWMRRWLKE